MKVLFLFFLSFNLFAFLPKSFRANYEEVHKSIVSGKEKKSEGVLEYQFPGKIRLVSEDEGTTFVSSGKISWYYTAPFFDGEPGYCTIKRSGDMGFIGLFDALKKGFKGNKLYRVKNVGKRKKIIFSKSGKEKLGIKYALLSFRGASQFKSLSEITIQYADERTVRLIFKSITIDKNFKKDYFVFLIPKKTKLNYQ